MANPPHTFDIATASTSSTPKTNHDPTAEWKKSPFVAFSLPCTGLFVRMCTQRGSYSLWASKLESALIYLPWRLSGRNSRTSERRDRRIPGKATVSWRPTDIQV
jgi:hypothetical protein